MEITNKETKFYMQFASALNVTVQYAKSLFSQHGKNKIYIAEQIVSKRKSMQGRVIQGRIFAFSNTQTARYSAVLNYGFCVIVDNDLNVIIRTAADSGKLNRAKNREKKRKERAEFIENYYKTQEEQKAQEETRYIFETCKGHVSEKKGGKGNSISDIGRYRNDKRTRFTNYETATHDNKEIRYNNHLLF